MAESIRTPIPWARLALLAFIVLPVFANAALNLIPHHVPTAREVQREQQREVVAARHARIDELLAEGDHCRPAIAHELARALVFDGRSARAYADDYERRCGADPVVRHWGDAPSPPRYSVR
jgi:hypothetical protein